MRRIQQIVVFLMALSILLYPKGIFASENKVPDVSVEEAEVYGASKSMGEEVAEAAENWLPYIRYGSKVNYQKQMTYNDITLDCSGFVIFVYAQVGYDAKSIPWGTSYMMNKYPNALTDSEMNSLNNGNCDMLRPGDIIMFEGHTAIYVGQNNIIHSLNYACDALSSNLITGKINRTRADRTQYLSYFANQHTCKQIKKVIRIFPSEDYSSSFPLKNGATYKIVSALSGKTMEVASGSTQNSKQINVWSYSGEPWMQWKAIQQADGYSFINVYTGKCLDIKDASASGGAKLTQYDYNGNPAQRFKLVDKGNGRYGMIACCSNLAVDLCGSSKENGALLDQHAFHGGDNQLWIFEPVDTEAPTISEVQVSNVNPNGYTVSCKVADAGGVALVQFPTWTEANGQDDLPADWPTSTRVVGDTYYYDVNTADHNNE